MVGRSSTLLHVLSLLVTCFLVQCAASNRPKTDEERTLEQKVLLYNAWKECRKMINAAVFPKDGVYCNMTFDNILCWPYTRAGTLAQLPCPGFVERFNPEEYATRECLSNGMWKDPPPDVNKTMNGWTNFTSCHLPPPTLPPRPNVPAIIKQHMPTITLVSKVGYSISLISLILAIIIMLYFKRLHCHRNTIHINLFVSFALRAVVRLLLDFLFVKGLGLPQDVIYDEDGDVSFNNEGTHWECKLLITMFHLALSANYVWIFVEGLYLHTLIFFAVFSQSKTIIKWYMLVGWVTPFLFVIPWVITRVFKNDTLCWNTHEKGYYWIIKGPIIATISVNFAFFLNIIRMLFTKLRATNTRDPRRYRKLARSTLVLIPLFGVHYIFFITISHQSRIDPGLEVVLMYLEMSLNSFQGTVVAFLFCFLNGEVRAEILKHWNRSRLRRYSTVSMGGRSSRALSTTSFFFRERNSISQAQDGVRPGSSRFPAVDSSVSLRSLGANGVLPSWGVIAEEQQDDAFAETNLGGRTRVSNGGLRRNAASAPVFRPCRESPPSPNRVRPNQNGHVTVTKSGESSVLDNNDPESTPMLQQRNGHHSHRAA